MGSCGVDASGPGQGPVASFYVHGNEYHELSGSIKGGEFLD